MRRPPEKTLRYFLATLSTLLLAGFFLPPAPVWAQTSGGPDGSGYRWVDSRDAAGPVFDWFDISGVGTGLSLGDDGSQEATLPFAFPFYGQNKSVIRIQSNGALTFGVSSLTFTNRTIPAADGFDEVIAPFWDDLDQTLGGSIHYYHDIAGQRFIVQWTGIPHNSNTGGVYTFQVILEPSGTVRFQYLTMVDGPLDSATIGIENADGSDGLQVAFNTAFVVDNLAIDFVPRPTLVRWAFNVLDFSSEAGGSNFSAEKALGEPNVFPAYGDAAEAWASATPDGQREYLVLEYFLPTPIDYVTIYETWNPGAVDTVYVKNPGTGQFEVVWSGTAAAQPPVSRDFQVTFPKTGFDVSQVRVAINSPAVPGWNEIDAVGVGLLLDVDSLALIALYNATDGGNWSNNLNWLTGPVDTWAGVTVSGGRVTELSLPDNGLSGTIPAEFAVLQQLTSLDLSGNSLTGVLPTELALLQQLTLLDLSENSFSGTIPDFLGTLAQLRRLDLSSNQLTGPIPSAVGSLANLTVLNLSDNQLTGSIPSELGDLAALNLLELGANQLTGPIPPELGDLAALNLLQLGANQLTGPIPLQLGSLTGLAVLSLQQNQLTGPIPPEIGSMTALTNLVVSDNALSGNVPAAFGSLTNLLELDISRNPNLREALPRSMTNLTGLATFHFDGTSVCGEPLPVMQDWLAGISNVTGMKSCPLFVTNGTLEARVEFTWEIAISGNSLFSVERDGTGIAILASGVREYADVTAVPGVVYEYCLIETKADNTDGRPVCATGSRKIFAPTNFKGTDGTFEDYVQLIWTDRSTIESGYALTRSGGTPIGPINVNANTAFYQDKLAEPGVTYTYTLLAYVDVDQSGTYTPGTDYVSAPKTDDGFRGFVMPPAQVDATDGQFTDRVRITWLDRSDLEDEYTIYRDSVVIATVSDPDPTTSETLSYDDTTAAAGQVYQYCVASVTGSMESVQVCDDGRRGALAPPQDVAASVDSFDDRVQVTWTDATDTEDGFEVFRDGVRIDSLVANRETYNDFTAAQGVDYDYCARAFSMANPAAVSYSGQVCAPAPGRRAYVLAPTDAVASDSLFEEKVGLTWANPSTTVMAFKIYRDGALIWTVSSGQTAYEDSEIASGVDYEYCVSSITVPGAGAAPQAQIIQLLASEFDAPAARTIEEATMRLAAVEGLLLNAQLESSSTAAAAIVESTQACDTGSRKLAAPTQVSAGFDQFEDRVEITWVDNSDVDSGYIVYRNSGVGPADSVSAVSAARSSFSDYTGSSGVLYSYSVRAYDNRGPGGESAADNDTGQRTLEAPTSLQAADGLSETEVKLTWTDNSRAETAYYIFRDGVRIDSLAKNSTTFTDTTPSFGVTHTYTVSAADNYGASAAATDDGKTAILPPGSVRASDVYTNRVNIIWVDRSNVESGYRVYRNGVLFTTLGVDAVFYPDTDIATGVTNEYCVATFAGSFESEHVCDNGTRPSTPPLSTGFTPEVAFSGSRAAVNDLFGYSVAIDGDWALVGAPFTDDEDHGAAYFFQRSGARWEQRDIVAGNATQSGFFGWSVDISGDFAIVGAINDDLSKGAVYIYELVGSTWQQVQRITSGTSAVGDRFGRSVSIDGDWAVVGAPSWDNGATQNAGRALFYKRETDGVWTQKSFYNYGLAGAEFGVTVSMNSDWVVIGAPNADVGAQTNDGTINFFKREGDVWNLKAGFNGVEDNQQLGYAVSMGEDWSAIGSPGRTVCASQSVEAGLPLQPMLLSRSDTDSALPGTEASPLTAAVQQKSSSDEADTDTAPASGQELSAAIAAPNCGSMIIFERNSDVSWTEIVAATVVGSAGGERRGVSVAIAGVNAVAGSAFNNVRSITFDGTWRSSEPSTYVGPIAPIASNNLSLGMSNNWIIFGSADANNSTGAAYMSAILHAPEAALATDGRFKDRIQVRWTDLSVQEAGFNIYRRNEEGTLEQVGTADPDVAVFDDFSVAPGDSYEYCVAAFLGDHETSFTCATGWRAPNGTIGGRIAALGGGGTEDVEVCLAPSPNRGLLLDGFGGYVRVDHVGTDEQTVQGANPFTVEGWVYLGPVGINRYILQLGPEGAGSVNWRYWASGDVVMAVGDDVSQRSVLPSGTWHHLASVWDGTNLKRYVDGVNTHDATPSAPPALPTLPALSLGLGFTGSQNFAGQMDEVRVWNEARTQDQITAAMNRRLEEEEKTNLVGYWAFDEGRRTVTADLTGNGNNGVLVDGAYWSDRGGFDICAITDTEGNYWLAGLRYGESTRFTVSPTHDERTFEPGFKTITLSTDSPVQNEVDFIDATAFTVAGLVQYVDGANVCPVPDVDIFLSQVQGGTAGERVFKTTTEADGTYRISVDPSADVTDLRRIEPVAGAGEDVHAFTPAREDRVVQSDLLDVNFEDRKRRTLTGIFGGSCNTDIGTATLHIYTENGCFDKTIPLVGGQTYEVSLPPQKYLVEVTDINATNLDLRSDILAFFDNLGVVEVDLTNAIGDGAQATRDFIYHAPVTITNPELAAKIPGSCTIITQTGEDGRTLPLVPVIGEFETVPLVLEVFEDYGGGATCPVDKGTVTIFDGIADLAGTPQTFEINSGTVSYSTFGASPNTFSGAVVEGVDRSFQKAFTTVAQVEGRAPVTLTEWAIVEGVRERSGTFVSATTDPIPMMVLHDPPGSYSYAYLEEGTTTCESISNVEVLGGGAGPAIDIALGFKTSLGGGFGVVALVENGAGVLFQAKAIFGQEVTKGENRLRQCLDLDAIASFASGTLGSLASGASPSVSFGLPVVPCGESNIEICMTATERWSTSPSETWAGEEIHAGVALNLLFAEADNLKVDPQTCTLGLTEQLALDLDKNKPFETTYVYGRSHIELSLIPALEEIIRLGGDQTVEGEITRDELTERESVRLTQAIENWNNHLVVSDSLTSWGISGKCAIVTADGQVVQEDCPGSERPLFDAKNRSFSSGADYEFSVTQDTTRTLFARTTRTYIDAEGGVGAIFTAAGYDNNVLLAFEVQKEWVEDTTATSTTSRTVGYVFSDGDTGDFYSIDVGTDPVFKTPVFETKSGRSSNPHQSNTQQRDVPLLAISPPVQFDVPPDDPAVFTLSLTNASESQERREYILDTIREINPGSAVIGITGDPIGQERFVIEADETISVSLAVERGPNRYDYENLGVYMYPQLEFDIWQADPRQDFAISDTVFFSVFFKAPCSEIAIQRPEENWTLNAATIGDGLDLDLWQFDLLIPATAPHADTVRTVGLQYRLQGTQDWLQAASIGGETLGLDKTAWSTNWGVSASIPNGPYDLRAFTECKIAGGGGRVFSDVISGLIDTETPEVLGTPTPTDQVLSLGSDISIAFNEPVDCGSVITSGTGANATITYLDGPDVGVPIPGVKAVCDGRTVFLNPPDMFDWSAVENRLLEARVEGGETGAKDLAGNPLEQDVAWAFTVKRSTLTWRPVNRIVNVEVGMEKTFSGDLVNGRAQPAAFTLEGMPTWLTASTTGGTLPPGGETTIDFTITNTLALGTLVDTLSAATDQGDALFFLSVDVLPEVCEPPDWTPAPGVYSMIINGQLLFDGVVSSDVNDKIAAFVGSEVRGVANVQDVTAASNLVDLVVVSNLAAGETITFRAFDASTCTEYPASEQSFVFAGGQVLGTPQAPEPLNAVFEVPRQEVALPPGWTMFSINRTPPSSDPDDVLAALAPANGDVLKSQTAFSLYDGATRSWIGALNEVVPGKGYMVKLSGPNSLIISGDPVDVLNSPIDLTPGWSWIGYHPQGSQTVDDALASLSNPDATDLIKSQYGFAQWSGGSWIGSLSTMDPGLGYMIKVANAGTVVYPDVPEGSATRVATNRPVVSDETLTRLGKNGTLTEEGAGDTENGAIDLSFKRTAQIKTGDEDRGLGTLSKDFKRSAFNMTVTAEVQIDDQPTQRPVFVGAFVDDEPRGLARATYVESLDSYRVFLMVYSDEAEGETLTFRILDDETDRFYDLNQTASFEADAILGTPGEPVVLDNRASGKLAAAEELPTEFALRQNYPNPFNPTTTIKYDVPSQSDVRIVLYDVLGREVRWLVDGNQKAGRYEVVFDASQIASGTYFYRMQAGDFQALHKMIVLK